MIESYRLGLPDDDEYDLACNNTGFSTGRYLLSLGGSWLDSARVAVRLRYAEDSPHLLPDVRTAIETLSDLRAKTKS